MIYQLLAKLFNPRDAYQSSYVAHPIQTLWGLLVMAMGWVAMTRDNWMTFGLITFILGVLLFVTVLFSINWDKSANYWDKIGNVFEQAGRIKDPVVRAELLQSMGYSVTPQNVTITEIIPESKDNGLQIKYHRLPVASATMQMIADKVLMSGNTDFTEPLYSNIPNYRKVQKQLKDKEMISPKNNKNVHLGYSFNRKGLDALYEYASESVKLELRKSDKKNI